MASVRPEPATRRRRARRSTSRQLWQYANWRCRPNPGKRAPEARLGGGGSVQDDEECKNRERRREGKNLHQGEDRLGDGFRSTVFRQLGGENKCTDDANDDDTYPERACALVWLVCVHTCLGRTPPVSAGGSGKAIRESLSDGVPTGDPRVSGTLSFPRRRTPDV